MTEQSVAETLTATKKKYPRFNHIAISLPPELLSETGRTDLLDFYGEVFGWVELPTMTEDGKRLVMGAYSYDQFVYLHADKKGPGLTAPPADHWGMGVSTQEEFDEFYARVTAYQDKDDRVEIIRPHVDDFGVLKLHGFYVRFLLPLMIEVQYFEFVPDGTYNGNSA